MSWEYRVVRDIDGRVSIREAHLDGKRVKSVTARPDPVEANTLRDLSWMLARMREALSKPMIEERNYL